MNTKKRIILFVCTLATTMTMAQSVEVLGGFFTFNMGDLKAIQLENQFQSSIEVFKVDEFPAQPAIEIQVTLNQSTLENNVLNFGIVGNSTATGGRLSFADFSGSYRIDQNLSRIALGPFVELLKESDKVFYGVNGGLMVSFTNLDFETELVIDGQLPEFQSISFNSTGINFRVLGILGYRLNSWAHITTKAGYQVDVYESKLTLSGNSDAFLLNPSRGEAKSKWSGIRLLFGVGFRI